ncbi:MAG: hypothetical protein AABZ74_08910 [Cyanobacteriota bacterium]
MKKNTNNSLRITISLNKNFSKDIDFLIKTLKVSKSKVFKLAFEKFSEDYKKNNLKKVAEMMREEYKNNKELTYFYSLDSELFL